MTVIYGREVADVIEAQLKAEIEQFETKPQLAVIQVGNNQASNVYVRNKERACERVGIESIAIHLKETVEEDELIQIIQDLNVDTNITGILVQLPLPSHINVTKVLDVIDPIKDVDGFHYINVGKMNLGMQSMLPCTPYGVIKMLEYINEDVKGKHAVVVGASNIVGKPMAQLLLSKGATVTICNSKTQNLGFFTSHADILVVAVGKSKLITTDMVKENAVVIDVGINRNEDGKLCGDVDFDNIVDKVKAISPVPKGVGVMTVTMLLYNTVEAYKLQNTMP